MDKIILDGMAFYGFHGLLDEEAVLGQKFFVDVEIYTDTKEAGKTDDMNKSISYADVYDLVKMHTEEKRYNLIEALAENIASDILENFVRANSVSVKIRKKEAPVRGIFNYMGVEIRRDRNE